MRIYVAIIPDNEILGVFSSKKKCEDAIVFLSEKDSYLRNWDIEPRECELDKIESDR